jgi:tellurite resistance protein
MTWARHGSTDTVVEQGRFAAAKAAERVRLDEQAGRAALTVAGHSMDASECAELLAMLGLSADGRNIAEQDEHNNR